MTVRILMEAGLRTKAFLVSLGLILVVSLAFAQSTSSDFPPDELLQHITADGLRAHMAFLSDDLLEGRGTGTRGYQLAANYVRAQFEEMGLKPAGTNGSYFQNVRFRKIELLRDKSSVSIKNNGLSRTLTIEKDYVMAGDPLSTDTRVEGQVVFVGYGVSAPEFGYDDYAGIDVRGKIVAAIYGAPPKCPPLPARISRPRNRNCGWRRSMGRLDFSASGPAKPNSVLRFLNTSVLREGRRSGGWMKKVYPMAPNRISGRRADKFQHGGTAIRRRTEIMERRSASGGEQSAAGLPADRKRVHAHRQPLLGGGKPERGCDSAGIGSPTQQ